jgi:hypothetical protein
MDATQLTAILNKSIQEYQERRQKKMKERHLQLYLECVEFERQLIDEIEKKLVMTAEHGKRTVYFRSKFEFSDKFMRFKVSTLVYGWKQSNNTWLTIPFHDIYKENMTPFDNIIRTLESRGIYIENMSDSSKGHGFWIQASF